MNELTTTTLTTPLGPITIAARGETLCCLTFGALTGAERRRLLARFPGAAIEERPDRSGIAAALRAYFAGDLHAIDTIAVDTGGTPFQASVWAALRKIPAGSTISYGELARDVGRPAAIRAVGQANGANPVAVVVPCHRVVRTGGALGGYGGGLPLKRWLLAHEGAKPREQALLLPLARGAAASVQR